MRSRIVMLVLIILALAGLNGCSKQIVLNPISGSDIIFLEQDQQFKAPKSGAFLSDNYMTEIANIRANNK